jgi:serine/threonine-protein kinase
MSDLDDDIRALSEEYEFFEKIGVGAMGIVYKARHKTRDRIFAIKFMNLSIISEEAIKRFAIEGKAASLLSHPNVILVHAFDTTEHGHPFMVMEYVDGITLADVISADGQIQVDRFLSIFDQVCQGLAHAHAHGIVHRDIKPGNIMLTHDDVGAETVRIMDFGMAKLLHDAESWSHDSALSDLTKTGETVGSPLYMSPEQIRAATIDQRSDLYSLGCVMYESLTGEPPFVGKTMLDTMQMHVSERPASLKIASAGKDFAAELEDLISRLLEKRPANRFASADELRLALHQVPMQSPQEQSPVVEEDRRTQLLFTDSPKVRRFPLTIVLICVAVVIGAALFFLSTNH